MKIRYVPYLLAVCIATVAGFQSGGFSGKDFVPAFIGSMALTRLILFIGVSIYSLGATMADVASDARSRAAEYEFSGLPEDNFFTRVSMRAWAEIIMAVVVLCVTAYHWLIYGSLFSLDYATNLFLGLLFYGFPAWAAVSGQRMRMMKQLPTDRIKP